MTKIIYQLIGDPHLTNVDDSRSINNAEKYLKICQYADDVVFKSNGKRKMKTLAIGDVGFIGGYEWIKKNLDPKNHKFFKGNHDYYDPTNQYTMPHDIGDYGVYVDEEDKSFKFFFMRGAHSKDWEYRQFNNWEWYEQEQLNIQQLGECFDLFVENKPKVVITHEAPDIARQSIFDIGTKDEDKNRTAQALQAMYDHHQPNLWIFGHHHTNVVKVIGNTVFMCLGELQTFSLEI